MSEQMNKQARKVESIIGNLKGLIGATIGIRGPFYIDIISFSSPNISQVKPLGILQLGIMLADSTDKINVSSHPIDQITDALDLISKGRSASPAYNNWKKSEKDSLFSYSQTYFIRG